MLRSTITTKLTAWFRNGRKPVQLLCAGPSSSVHELSHLVRTFLRADVTGDSVTVTTSLPASGSRAPLSDSRPCRSAMRAGPPPHFTIRHNNGMFDAQSKPSISLRCGRSSVTTSREVRSPPSVTRQRSHDRTYTVFTGAQRIETMQYIK